MKRITKSYLELIALPTFEQRFEYLKLGGRVAEETFGSRRWYNQQFYQSYDWQQFRNRIIIRDNGCDLGVEGFEIHGSVYIHHINPVTYDDIVNRAPCLFDPNNAICVSFQTHNAIHYGDANLIPQIPVERQLNDTCPWKI